MNPGVNREPREIVKDDLIRAAIARRNAKHERAQLAKNARHNLIDFNRYTKRDYQADRFHIAVCEIFQQFFEDVLADKRPRVILSAPPQHGKSEIVSRRFPIWAIGKVPRLRLICASYGAILAQELQGHRIAALNTPEYAEVFPEQKITTKRTDLVRTIAGGHMIAAGVDQGITGRSADIGIIDDPIKGYREAVSETVRDSIWNWYRTDFYSRLQKGAGVIVMMTRWHEDDLIGRLLAAGRDDGEQWQVYNFPAEATVDNDELGRMKGEALAPGRYDERALSAIKKVQGSYAWGALYQGEPAPAEGLMLKRDYWRFYTADSLPEFSLIIVSVDAAFKVTEDSDHVAIHAWGFIGPRGYLLDRTCERMGYTATKTEAKRMSLKWRAHSLIIEDAANGPAAIEELRRDNELTTRCSVIPVSAGGGKLARAWPFSADLEAGNVYLPADQEWGAEIVNLAAKFPATAMDHDIDAMTHAYKWRRENMHGLLEYMKSRNDGREQEAIKTGSSIQKVETSGATPRCPAAECGSLAVRDLDGMGRMRCNQCGHQWDKNPMLDTSPTQWARKVQ